MPIDLRFYTHPDGSRARLKVDHANGPDRSPLWQVRLVRENGDVRRVAGQPGIIWCQTRDEARLAYRERLVALRVEGWWREM